MNISSLIPKMVAELIQTDGKHEVVYHEDNLRNELEKCGDSKIMFIPIIGPYQTGKSTLLSILLRNNNIEIGDSINEQTMGVYIIGPVDIRELKALYKINFNPNQNLKIFFVDTQGYGGFTAGDYEENKINITRLVSTYIPLSQVVLIYTCSNISISSIATLDGFFSLMSFCFSSFDPNSIKIVNINRLNGASDINHSFPSLKKYYQLKRYLFDTQSPRFDKIKIDDYMPFPYYNNTFTNIFRNFVYNINFSIALKFLVKDLFSIIDSASENLGFDRERLLFIHNEYVEATKNGSLELFANISRKNADLEVLRRQINNKFINVIKQNINIFKTRLERRKRSMCYPFIQDYKNYDDLIQNMQSALIPFIEENRFYDKDVLVFFKDNIFPLFIRRCNECILELEADMMKCQISITISKISAEIDELYNNEILRIQNFGGERISEYSFEHYRKESQRVLDEKIGNLRNCTSFQSAIDNAFYQAKKYINMKYFGLYSYLDEVVKINNDNNPSLWRIFGDIIGSFLKGVAIGAAIAAFII